ncbi:DUF222 domain-containing protein [Leucobacter sp. CSA1]|uniref:DUF222 domain-containing protein n=1 Tax=Leucobacter chromiisoli TaxID=2796471 RepID=A0A934Q6S1_9MICO|nr:HNH endonuclease signature motif containing protein [Leucobacter chromiisoli]MBK0418468.1 DUF222 domain-containing protein [Leucobacter chromiisoli]
MNAPHEIPNASILALDSVVSRLESVERRIREAEADRVALLAEAFDIASAESDGADSSVPTGSGAELAYRAVRAEVAAALRMSERTAEKHLDHARTLTRHYAGVFEALRAGDLSYRHTTVICDAGAVIGSSDGPDGVIRRARYEEAVLPVAIEETPNRLHPVARRLAERFAETSLDERHAAASRLRRVFIIDREDGMADLVAHLPAVEAYGIYHRLTALGREVSHARAAASRDRATSQSRTALQSRAPLQGPAALRSRAALQSLPVPRNSSVFADHAPHGRAAQAPEAPRTLDEIRADLLADLALMNIPSLDEDPPAGLPADPAAGVSASRGSPASSAPSSAEWEADRRPSPRRIGAIQARVQVVLPAEILFPPGPGESRGESSGERRGERDGHGDDSAARTAVGEPFDPPHLVGYGPIDAASARRLAARAPHWEEISVHPLTGDVLSVDRYRASEQMRRFLGARDLHCRFPGCRAPIARCDLDHTVDAALGGETSTANLAHLCRGHHTLKHHTGWRVKQQAGGVLEWSSPTGRSYTEKPPSRVMFRPAPRTDEWSP